MEKGSGWDKVVLLELGDCLRETAATVLAHGESVRICLVSASVHRPGGFCQGFWPKPIETPRAIIKEHFATRILINVDASRELTGMVYFVKNCDSGLRGYSEILSSAGLFISDAGLSGQRS